MAGSFEGLSGFGVEIVPLLDSVKLKTLRKGRPKKRVKVLAADKGYDSKEQRAALRKRGIRHQLPKRTYKTKKNRVFLSW